MFARSVRINKGHGGAGEVPAKVTKRWEAAKAVAEITQHT